MKVSLKSKGNWSKTTNWLKKAKTFENAKRILEPYGREGVAALSAATPVDTGKSASSWNYRIVQNAQNIELIFTNDNETTTGIPIVILLQYGHGTKSGTYVQGRDFINPAIQPIFDKIAENVWKEVTG